MKRKLSTDILDDFPTYAAELLKIPTKSGELEPFILNRVQRALWIMIKRGIDSGEPIRMIILKARQMGVSTLLQALQHWFVTTNTERNALTVAHDFDASQNLQKMQSVFYKNNPIKPAVRAWSRSLIEFDTDRHKSAIGLQSKIYIDTAANGNLGRSYTIHFFHGSEVAAWERVAEGYGGIKSLFAALNQAIPARAGTWKFLESTAQGEGFFKNLWDENYNKKLGTAYNAVFLSWVAYDEYRIITARPFDLGDSDDARYGDEKTEWERIAAQVRVWYPEYTKERQITRECWRRLKWRRNKIDTDCEHDVMIFRQEFPTCAQDAFAASGVGIFDQFRLSDRLAELEPEKDQVTVPHTRYRFEPRTVNEYDPDWWQRALQPANHGEFWMFEQPDDAATYVIGADSCYGVDDDKAGAVVLRLSAKEVVEVATFYGNVDADEFGEILYAIGRGYNNAMLAPEIDGPGLSTIHRLEKLRYPYLYYMRELNKPGQPGSGIRWGFHTNSHSKPVMVNKMREFIRDGYIRFNHPETVRQCRAYRQVQGPRTSMGSGRRFEAAVGFHDDLVISAMIAVQLSVQTHMRVGKAVTANKMRQWNYWVEKEKKKNSEWNSIA